jgi:prevent-host-death family protein
MLITATEFKANFGKYLNLLDKEEIILTKNGRRIARIVRGDDEKRSSLQSFFGVLKDSPLAKATDEELRGVLVEERRKRYENID